ncbi:MAG: DUF4105 domain-containing protein [Bacteroides sp.]|nr:DUF4105 domain-containing protein [Bacteroides sp.]
MKRFLTAVLCCLSIAICSRSQTTLPADSIRVSLMTCGAGSEIYSLFGHTAIRYEQPAKGIDFVFNYGIFNFNAPNFVLRFTLGETDYLLGVSEYRHFVNSYQHMKRDVWEQELNLTQEEKLRLFAQLEENYRPENREYRYNFFFDNCATRPRDQIEKAITRQLVYAEEMNEKVETESFRKMIHKYTENHPWSRFGIDLCLGSEADKPISRREMTFVPFYLMDVFGQAKLIGNEQAEASLVKGCKQLVSIPQSELLSSGNLITPLQTSLLIFIIITILTIYGLRKQKTLWIIDLLLFASAGIAGCILAFLVLFSQHPTVSPNYLLFVFHPLHLFCLPWMLRKVAKRKKSIYLSINLVVLTLFLLLWTFIPQEINLAVLPLVLCLWIRSASNLVLTYNPKTRE